MSASSPARGSGKRPKRQQPSVGRFLSDLFTAKLEHDRVRSEGVVDTGETIGLRFELGKLADQLKAAVKEIEEQVRTQAETR